MSIYKKKKSIIYFIQIIVFNSLLLSQWNVITNKILTTKTMFSIRNIGLPKKAGYYFPEYKPDDRLFTDGYSIIKKQKVKKLPFHHKNKILAWEKTILIPIVCELDSTIFYQRIFAKNVNNYSIYFWSPDQNSWYVKNFDIRSEKYQIPQDSRLSEWYWVNTSKKSSDTIIPRSFLSDTNRNSTIAKIVIVVNKIDESKDFEFVIADMKIYNQKEVEMEFHHPFFDPITKKKSLSLISEDSFSVGSLPISLSIFSYYITVNRKISSGIKIIPTTEFYNEKYLLFEVFEQIFNKYPFYKERGQNKQQILNSFKRLPVDSLDFNQLVDSLNIIVDKLQDPHFYIEKYAKNFTHKTRKIPGPIHLYEINNQIYIAAVFDTVLNKNIKYGMEVIEIDGRPIDDVLDSLSVRSRGNKKVRRRKAISRVLYRQKDENINMVVKSTVGDTLNVKISYNNKLFIPDNFKPKHGSFKMLRENVAYFRISRWKPGTWIRFLNNTDDLKNSELLVIDLRGNSGGSIDDIIRLSSCFIKEPAVLLHEVYNSNDYSEIFKESLVIRPNGIIDFSDLKVIILINEMTACGSEIFIDFMKNNTKTIVIGSGKTSGAFANVQPIMFPSGLQVKLNTLTTLVPAQGVVFEYNGLEPDIWVHINKVEDLAPYNDKILLSALALYYKP